MGGSSTTTQQQSQQSKTDPWSAAQPALSGLLGKIQGVDPSLTQAQTGAINSIEANASNLPNYTPQTQGLISNLFSGGPDFSGGVTSANDALKSQLTPYASGANIGANNPALRAQLDTIRNDVTSDVNGQFAAAGRDMSPANSQAVARGVAQGEAPVIAGQYNQDVNNQFNAANALYGAGGNTAGMLSNLFQTGLGNQMQGVNTVGALPSVQNQGANTILSAEGIRQQTPLQNIGMLTNSLVPIAGLGSESSGNMTGTTTQQQPLLPTLLGGAIGGLGLLGKMGMLPSDRRVKENIERIGSLFDCQPVYRFNYIGDPTVHIGLMAQDVELRDPDAVVEMDGIKHVNYRRATDRAARFGQEGHIG